MSTLVVVGLASIAFAIICLRTNYSVVRRNPTGSTKAWAVGNMLVFVGGLALFLYSFVIRSDQRNMVGTIADIILAIGVLSTCAMAWNKIVGPAIKPSDRK